MNKSYAKEVDFTIMASRDNVPKYYPYLKDSQGNKTMFLVTPQHGRSFVVGQHNNGRYIVSKGNGLAYTEQTFLYTPEMSTDVWGLLLQEDALRDYHCGIEVQSFGIKTNQMECVLELNIPIHISQSNTDLKPCLLQYSVECPYRISDAPFMTNEQIMSEVTKWQLYNKKGYTQYHMIAADVLINNIRIMHNHQILHNALNEQNYTWALELLDFELCRTPNHPYTKSDYERHVPSLFNREVIQTYCIINYIAGVLREIPDYKQIDSLFAEYGFHLSRYTLN